MSYSRQESYTLSVCMQTASLKFVSQFCPLMKINPFIIIGFFPVIEYDKTKKNVTVLPLQKVRQFHT